MSRTDAEIITHINEIEGADFFGFERSDLIEVLSFDAAKPLLNKGATPESWGEPKSRDRESVLARMKDYMPFAWDKANGCRGLSAIRSMSHMRAWVWLSGEPDFVDFDNYDYYGKPQLRAICEHFGWDWRSMDDGDWRRDEDGPVRKADDVSA